jgi:hypothetical protein
MTERNHRGHELRPHRDAELEALLRRYADERLRLDAETSRRLREHFLTEAARWASEPTRLDARRVRLPWAVGRGRFRRAATALLAAALAVGAVAGAAAASEPGGPLYGFRLWVETVTLPADASARADAEIARLEARLSEATDAAEHDNGVAVRAALEAYRETVASALQAAGNDLDRADRLEIVLERHQVVLDTLAERLPAPAAEAVTQTIERNRATIEKIKAHGKPSPSPGPGDGGSPAPSAAPSHEPGGPPSPKPGRTPPGQGKP